MSRRAVWQKLYQRFDVDQYVRSPAGEPLDRAARRERSSRCWPRPSRAIARILAFYSGGRARDFVKMIHMIAQEAWQADADAATDAIVESVLDQERRLLETGLSRTGSTG